MTWLFLPILIAAAFAAYFGGRAMARRRGEALPAGERSHSRPGQHGAYALIWTVVPAMVVLFAAAVFSPDIEQQLTATGAPEAVQQLEPFRREAFFADARAVGDGRPAVQIWTAPFAEMLPVEGQRAARISQMLDLGGIVGAALAALLGALFVFGQIRPGMRARNRVEGWIVGLLFACSAVAVLTTVGIIASLVYDSLRFFSAIPVADFLFGTQWSPQTAIRADQVGSTGAFGALPLFAGTFLIMLIAMAVAAPVGLFAAIYLSEYAGPVFRATVKPVLEILAGVPTVVYGFFAALTVGPLFRAGFNAIGAQLAGGPFNDLGLYLG
ncbi:MAG: Phosphate transport system permease protein pstC, partial [Pseudomonadota bacterium]